MTIELLTLFIGAVIYLGLLFLIAYSADSGVIPRRVIDHPLTYALSLGVYATSWTFYGSVGLAKANGIAFITIYLGVTAAFLLGPYLLRPILRLAREYQLASVADILAFRYGGRASGFIATVFMLIGILPYLSLQIRAVTESTQVITREAPPYLLALTFCVLITVFAILFGARHLTPREKHSGLVAAIAFESAIKLIALLVAGMFAITQVFGGFSGIQQWAEVNPRHVSNLYEQTGTGLWTTLLLLSFSAAFLLPRQYHMTFVENERPESLNTAFWLFPLYLLLLNLPIIPILWAGEHLSLAMAPDFYVLGLSMTLGDQWLTMLTYIGGLSAASAMMIVTSLALSYMCLNHLLLPASISANNPATDLYRWILWSKRLIILAIFAAGYGFYLIIELNEGLANLGLISFVAAIQLLPGMLGLLFWTRATQAGFISGLLGGAAIWFLLLILPLVTDSAAASSIERMTSRLGFADVDIWSFSTFCSLTVNGLLFIVGSLITRQSDEERDAALACANDTLQPLTHLSETRSTTQLVQDLEPVLGSEAAHQEVQRAIDELGISAEDNRPAILRMLHAQLERNLSGLLGPTVARLILRGSVQLREPSSLALTESLRFMETRLHSSRQELRGVNRELDALRRYLRSVLQELPLGVCSVDRKGQILIWNSAMQNMSGIEENQALGSLLGGLSAPWSSLLTDFSHSPDNIAIKQKVVISGQPATFNLHKSSISESTTTSEELSGIVILVENRTDLDMLESELAHSERLASIGRLAAGVAHEIGNPLTGIASIAQNLHYDNDVGVLQESSADILDQVKRINLIVKSLLTFSHSESVIGESRVPVELADVVTEAIRLVQLSNKAKKVHIHSSIPTDLYILASPQQLTQVFVNLLKNACDASLSGDSVEVSSSTTDEEVDILIKDHGEGIEDANMQRIFEPFYTSKPVGQGTGLGLPLVRNIVNEHNGRLSISSKLNTGTEVRLVFPLHDPNDDTLDSLPLAQ